MTLSLTTFADGTVGWGSVINQNLTSIQTAVNGFASGLGVYGDGSDGSVTLDGTTTVGWATKSGSLTRSLATFCSQPSRFRPAQSYIRQISESSPPEALQSIPDPRYTAIVAPDQELMCQRHSS